MLIALRIVFGAALAYAFVDARDYAATQTNAVDVFNAMDIAICAILGIANAIVWAPYFGEKLSTPLTAPLVCGEYVDQKNQLRIPTKSDTRSENIRTPIPIHIGHLSERSDAMRRFIKRCPNRVKFLTTFSATFRSPKGRRKSGMTWDGFAPWIRAGRRAAETSCRASARVAAGRYA